ncbi:MAG TPA: hypothetical protein VKR59_16020 [Terriglobales bacterium]|nr:hypothetical protein [Terriglobales bacterium]
MLNKTLWFSLILGLTSAALAHVAAQPEARTMTVEAESPHATQTCQVTYSSGTFYTSTQFCVTVNGNIPQFKVRGGQLFPPAGNAADLEGYGFCDVTGGFSYMDYAAYDNDTWNPSTLKQIGNTVTVTRTTADGNWQLTQTIVNQPASAASVGGVKITMKLKNLSSTARAVNLVRFATPDVGGLKNLYNTSQYSASGLFEYGIGLTLTVNSFLPSFGQEAYVQNIQSGPDPCNPLEFWEMTLPYNGFGSIAVLWDQAGTAKVAPKGTVTVVSTYRGF